MDDRILDPINRQDFPEDFNQPKPGWWDWMKTHALALTSGILILILIIVAGLWFLRDQGEQAPENPNVLLSIKGPDSIASGNEAEYRVIYTNGENTDLSGITLEVFYPSNFKFASATPESVSANGQRFNLPVLRQGQSGEVRIRGKLVGTTGESKEVRAKLTYTMSNFSSEFTTDTTFTTAMRAPELELEITGPIDVYNGQSTTFTVNYRNVSGKEFDVSAIDLTYPGGFEFISSQPAPTKNNNYWALGKLPVDAVGKIEVTGNFISDPGTEVQVSGDLGLVINNTLAPQIHASARFKLQGSKLAVTQQSFPGEIVKLGETIQVTLKYANYDKVGQSNVVVSTTLEGTALDLTKLKASNGIVTGNTITWKSATVPNLSLLSPNQTGELTFTVPVKSGITTNIKNQTITSTTSILSDQNSSPVKGTPLQLKLASELGMIISGSYVSGAMPMQVGQSTTFDINILLTNLGNDISDTAVIASMPLPVGSWGDVIQPDAEKTNVTFDRNASKIRWRIGDLPAFVGKFSPARTMTFRLNVTPSEGDRGRSMTLLRDIQASGVDTFTSKEIASTKLNQLLVSDLDDDVIDSKGSTVE
ncbi:MAG TPA: hypothetical protein VEC17_01440 [Candidatus Binatia bacterium]|nr:hypothetical protein [Candidatus Binatia bacterium]